jgi:hypothetical protein
MSWKQYGGVRKQDKYHNITIGTLVADEVLVRQKYTGVLDFQGSITVESDSRVKGNMVSQRNTFSLFDMNIGQDLYLNNRMYFGVGYNDYTTLATANFEPLLNSTSVYPYLSGSNVGIGINITNPLYAFEVNGIADTQTNIFTSSSRSTTNRSIIAKNVNNRGLVVTAQDTISKIGFFSETVATNPASVENAAINYQNGGLFSIVSPYINLIPGNNTNILSNLRVSLRDTPATISNEKTFFNETAIIFDTSNGPYLYSAFENPNTYCGNATSFIANDASSVTFVNLITTNKQGLSVGGGVFPNDTSRSYGSLAMCDSSGNYKTNQTIVSGNSLVKYATTLGINSYAPKVDNYVLDINGPTHLGSTEIMKVAGYNFEVKQVSFSKINKNYAIAVGTPASTLADNLPVQYRFRQYAAYTTNAGKTWNLTYIIGSENADTDLERAPTIFVCSLYDASFGIIGTDSNFIYYTKNGGKSWVEFFFSNSRDIENARDIYIAKNQTGGLRTFLVYILNSGEQDIEYFDIPDYTILPDVFSQTQYLRATTYPIPAPTVQNILYSDGYGEFVYFVGNGIAKYRVSDAVSLYSTEMTHQYNQAAAYDNSYAIAVGNNIISVTRNGTDWMDYIPSSQGLGNITLNSIYIYDTKRAVAVGNAGAFVYTTDGANTWQIVPNAVLNESGISTRINGTNNRLLSVYMYDIESFLITNVKGAYVYRVVGNTIFNTQGNTNMYYCTIPNIFNRVNNDLLDLSGNMNIDGDIKLNSGGRIISLDSTFDLLSTNVTTLNVAASATNINIGNTETGGFTNIQNQLSVAGNTSFQNNLNVNGNLQAENWLIRGTLDLSLSRHFFLVAQDASMQSNLYVQGLTIMQDGSFNASMSVGTDSSFNGNIYVGGNTVLNKALDVYGNTNLYNNLNISGDMSANRNVDIIGNAQLYSSLDVSDNAILRNGLSVANDTSLGGNLTVTGTTILKGKFVQQGSTTFTGGLSILTPALIGSSIDVSDNAVIRNNLSVLGDISLNRRLFIGNSVVINKPPNTAKLSAILDVSGAVMATSLGIATQSVNSQYSLDISGHTNSTGCIFQF